MANFFTASRRDWKFSEVKFGLSASIAWRLLTQARKQVTDKAITYEPRICEYRPVCHLFYLFSVTCFPIQFASFLSLVSANR